ncbi:MAG: Lrp/AsnC family transcriptional regulator [Candidatus Glassbacteria bacterium]|nr:Lrp/AsnC family transcriptional regulator [Candidatus Glassbacteria bacterium]
MSKKDKKLIRLLQVELPLVERPYAELSERLGMSEREVLDKVSSWVGSGIIRRFGATVRHQRMGYSANSMVVWRVTDPEVADRAGEIFAGFPEVTHCYRRPEFEGWPYTLYTMVHATSQEGIEQTLERMKEASGLDEYRGLLSEKEWKKTSMQYFSEEEDQ